MLPRFLLRMRKRGGYRQGFGQRLAWYDADTRARLAAGDRVWVHAVSVGELFVAFRIMEALRAERPDLSFAVTTTTSTGHAIARERLSDPDVVLYFPVDTPVVIRRVLRMINPQLVVLVEYELWPNLVRLCKAGGIPVTLVNGRLSERSYAGYRKLHAFTRKLLPMVDVMCMQGEGDAERIQALGAPAEHVHVVGSPKYEIVEQNEELEARTREALSAAGMSPADCLILLGGSTWPGEEAALIAIYRALKPVYSALKLVLVPRHVERAPAIMRDMEGQELVVLRRSEVSGTAHPPRGSADVLLVDTTGELRHFYAHASVIFVGKSLTSHGGQNIIEPAVYGKPIVVGPHMENFPVIMDDFLKAEAISQVPDEQALQARVRALLADTESRASLGSRARQLVRDKAGAVGRTLALVTPLLPDRSP